MRTLGFTVPLGSVCLQEGVALSSNNKRGSYPHFLWTVAHQAPLFMGFPRQEYWSRLPFRSLLSLFYCEEIILGSLSFQDYLAGKLQSQYLSPVLPNFQVSSFHQSMTAKKCLFFFSQDFHICNYSKRQLSVLMLN